MEPEFENLALYEVSTDLTQILSQNKGSTNRQIMIEKWLAELSGDSGPTWSNISLDLKVLSHCLADFGMGRSIFVIESILTNS